MEAERPKQRRWNGVDDPISHCLAGNSLLLTGLPGTGKTHHCGEAARAGRGGAPGVQDALLRAEPGAGGADGRPLGAQVRARGQRAKAGLAGGGGDHAAGHGALGGPGLRGAERRREVPAAELPAVLDSWAGGPSALQSPHGTTGYNWMFFSLHSSPHKTTGFFFLDRKNPDLGAGSAGWRLLCRAGGAAGRLLCQAGAAGWRSAKPPYDRMTV